MTPLHFYVNATNECSYIGVPVDIGSQQISGGGLARPLTTALPPNDAEKESAVTAEIIHLLGSRKSPVIVVDGGKSHDYYYSRYGNANANRCRP